MPAKINKKRAAKDVATMLDLLESITGQCRCELEEKIEADRVDWETVLEDCDEICGMAQRMWRIAQIACREES